MNYSNKRTSLIYYQTNIGPFQNWKYTNGSQWEYMDSLYDICNGKIIAGQTTIDHSDALI